MTELDRLQACTAIQRVLALHAQLLDDLRIAEFGELFCENATWAYGALQYQGRKSIMDGVGGMQPKVPGSVRHVALTPVVDLNGDEAFAWTDFMALSVSQNANAVVAVGRYYDTFRKEGGRWRFFKRYVVPCGEAPPPGVRLSPAA